MGESLDFTAEQKAAIDYRGGSLLVSAAAGSGKTKVLVERLLCRVAEGNDVDDFLVITYTRAAAAELRERIYEEISEKIAAAPDNRRLRRQSLLCRSASIDTIHGFCTDIIRENAHLVGLPPDFRVADDSESGMIRAEVLEDVLNSAYETIDTTESFGELVEMVSPGRDDRRLSGIVLDAHAKLRSNPNPREWAESQISALSLAGVSDVSETVWGAYLMDRARGIVKFRYGEMERLRAVMAEFPEFEAKYGDSVEATISDIGAFSKALDTGWDEAQRYGAIDFSRVKPKSVSGYDELKDVRLRCKAALKKAAEIFECTSDEHIEDMRAIAPAMTALLRLILDFDDAYMAEKRRRGAVDFSDLEHLALSLLIDGETGGKTGIAKAISRRFSEVLVDEYQDVNAIQELIFNAVSQDGMNIFMVGDVKQSVYRFRLADPTIFLAKYGKFKDANEGDKQDGLRILLSTNFRSKAGILEAVNLVFGGIMSAEFGELEYTEREALVAGRQDLDLNSELGVQDAGFEDAAVELDLIDMSTIERDEDEESPVKTEIEARFIAERIKELISSGYKIPDRKQGARPLCYSDIVILLRSVQNKAWQYAAALTEHGIPVDMPGDEGFFETTEITAALSLLSVIDNPMQDIPLAAALRGPVYGFSADELAGIRAGSRASDYYSALVTAAATDERCATFLKEMEELREVMPDMPTDRFIWHVYNKTGLPGRVGAMRGGERRRSNLILLAEYARLFEKSGYKGLFSFLVYIRGVRERGAFLSADPALQTSGGASGDAVRLMSVHKSKGLEFPVVILADTSRQLNRKDIGSPLVIHPVLGLGPKRTDGKRRIEYTTLARMAVQSKLTSELMAEELRILYVAMTRAREKLIVTAAFKDAGREIEKLSKLTGRMESGPSARQYEKIPPQVLEESASMAGWILLPLLRGKWEIENGKLTVEGLGRGAENNAWDIRLVSAAELQREDQQAESPASKLVSVSDSEARAPKSKPEDVELLRQRFGFEYAYQKATELPSKLTVTGLKERVIDPEAAELPEAVSGEQRRFAFSRPDFISKKAGLTAAERGTALHRAMQCIDFSACGNKDGVKKELDRLSERGFLTEQQAAAVDTGTIARFFDSSTGRRVLDAKTVGREFRFSLLYPASRFYEGGGSDRILLQGVIDCYFEEHDEITIVDFKTDHVTPDTIDEKVKQYTPQLAAYSEALERITGKRVRERLIYFFSVGESVSV